MYWPIGTPRIYATSSSRTPDLNLFVSYDGLQQPDGSSSSSSLGQDGQPRASAAAAHEEVDILPPPTPLTPATPVVQPILEDDLLPSSKSPSPSDDSNRKASVPLKDPVLALAVARTGHLFGVITATSITLWQTKVR